MIIIVFIIINNRYRDDREQKASFQDTHLKLQQ